MPLEALGAIEGTIDMVFLDRSNDLYVEVPQCSSRSSRVGRWSQPTSVTAILITCATASAAPLDMTVSGRMRPRFRPRLVGVGEVLRELAAEPL
jgi:hypothetical protein